MARSARVWGPYRHGRGYRLYFSRAGKKCATETVATREEAERLKRALVRELETLEGLTIEVALMQYERHLVDKGNKAQSVKGTLLRMREFFPDQQRSLRSLTPKDGGTLYRRLVTEPRKATGKPLAADSHRNYLAEAKSFLRWCVAHGWLAASPLAHVIGQGRRRRGKAQLGIDEAQRLSATALERVREGDVGALAVLVLLHMGLRAGELVNLRVRDLDHGGRILWIREATDSEVSHLKTPAARRAPKVPACLQAPLLLLAAGRKGNEKLFGQHWRDWPREQTARLCKLAGVESVTAHGLRGLKATLSLLGGEDPDVVARSLGHTSSKITLDVYAAPGTREQLEQQRLEETLTGSAKRQSAEGGPETHDGQWKH